MTKLFTLKPSSVNHVVDQLKAMPCDQAEGIQRVPYAPGMNNPEDFRRFWHNHHKSILSPQHITLSNMVYDNLAPALQYELPLLKYFAKQKVSREHTSLKPDKWFVTLLADKAHLNWLDRFMSKGFSKLNLKHPANDQHYHLLSWEKIVDPISKKTLLINQFRDPEVTYKSLKPNTPNNNLPEFNTASSRENNVRNQKPHKQVDFTTYRDNILALSPDTGLVVFQRGDIVYKKPGKTAPFKVQELSPATKLESRLKETSLTLQGVFQRKNSSGRMQQKIQAISDQGYLIATPTSDNHEAFEPLFADD